MNHTILIGGQLYKCAEVHDTHHFAVKYHARLNICNDSGNNLDGLINHSLVRAAYIYSTVVRNVNLNTGLLNNLVDNLALLSYHIANLLRIDGNLLNLRGIWA